MRGVNTYIALALSLSVSLSVSSAPAEEAVSGPFYMFRVPLDSLADGSTEDSLAGAPGSLLSFFANGNGEIQAPTISTSGIGTWTTDDRGVDPVTGLSNCQWKLINGVWNFHCPGGPKGMVVVLRSVERGDGIDFEVQSWIPFRQPTPITLIDGFSPGPDGFMVPEGLVNK